MTPLLTGLPSDKRSSRRRNVHEVRCPRIVLHNAIVMDGMQVPHGMYD